jgi:hypothetical protein
MSAQVWLILLGSHLIQIDSSTHAFCLPMLLTSKSDLKCRLFLVYCQVMIYMRIRYTWCGDCAPSFIPWVQGVQHAALRCAAWVHNSRSFSVCATVLLLAPTTHCTHGRLVIRRHSGGHSRGEEVVLATADPKMKQWSRSLSIQHRTVTICVFEFHVA